MGAISQGIEQEIYFEVCHKNFDGLLSPIVICGPKGIQFHQSIELTLPHHAGNDPQQISLMLHGINQSNSFFQMIISILSMFS